MNPTLLDEDRGGFAFRLGELAHRHRHAIATLLFVVLCCLIFFPVWVWQASTERRALERLRLEQRRELYWETLRETKAACAAAAEQPALRPRCDQLADMLERSPECDTECRAFVQSVQHRAAR